MCDFFFLGHVALSKRFTTLLPTAWRTHTFAILFVCMFLCVCGSDISIKQTHTQTGVNLAKRQHKNAAHVRFYYVKCLLGPRTSQHLQVVVSICFGCFLLSPAAFLQSAISILFWLLLTVTWLVTFHIHLDCRIKAVAHQIVCYPVEISIGFFSLFSSLNCSDSPSCEMSCQCVLLADFCLSSVKLAKMDTLDGNPPRKHVNYEGGMLRRQLKHRRRDHAFCPICTHNPPPRT